MKRWRAVILDTLLMTFGLGTLTMMNVAKLDIISHFGITSEVYDLQHNAYVLGLFIAFLLGHTRLYQGSFKRSVAIALSFAAIPQIIIPYAHSWWVVVFLRFIQGFVISLVPLFSTQIGNIFVAERPLAKGIILSGIFWGGLLGTFYGEIFVELFGWKLAFPITALMMYAALALWWILTEDFTIMREEGHKATETFKMPFTWILGFTFFPALWVIFTIVGFVTSVGYSIGWSRDMVANISYALNTSKALWSIIMGYVGFMLSRKNPSPKGLFRAIVLVMIASYIIGLIGLLIFSTGVLHKSYEVVLIGMIFVGAIQGTGPAFWTSAPAAYPKEIFPQAAFALGLISNSANAVAPTVTKLLASHSVLAALGGLSVMPLIGIAFLLVCMRLKLPIEK